MILGQKKVFCFGFCNLLIFYLVESFLLHQTPKTGRPLCLFSSAYWSSTSLVRLDFSGTALGVSVGRKLSDHWQAISTREGLLVSAVLIWYWKLLSRLSIHNGLFPVVMDDQIYQYQIRSLMPTLSHIHPPGLFQGHFIFDLIYDDGPGQEEWPGF